MDRANNKLEYNGYIGIYNWDHSLSIYYGEVVNSESIITFCGSSIEELMESFIDSIEKNTIGPSQSLLSSNKDVVSRIDWYLDNWCASAVEQLIMREAKKEIVFLRSIKRQRKKKALINIFERIVGIFK